MKAVEKKLSEIKIGGNLLRQSSTEEKNKILLQAAQLLLTKKSSLLKANAQDVKALAALFERVRGYGHVKLANVAMVKHILISWAELGDAFGGRIDPRAAKRSKADAENEAISLRTVMLQVANASNLGLVILDACRNNPFSAKMQRSLRTLETAEPKAIMIARSTSSRSAPRRVLGRLADW